MNNREIQNLSSRGLVCKTMARNREKVKSKIYYDRIRVE